MNWPEAFTVVGCAFAAVAYVRALVAGMIGGSLSKARSEGKTTTGPLIGPYAVERHDQIDGYITYKVVDERTGSYREVCAISEDDTRYAKLEADQIALGLNLLVQQGMEKLPPDEEDDE